ncbi:MAG: hypothetical protein IPK24_22445 [Kineosporiaceae bacterium]|nr:hypothetical protein [Kineosporiaceae bacterium]
MARSNTVAQPVEESPAGISSAPEVPAEAPAPIDLSGFDPEAHAAKISGGYTVTTAPVES